MNILQIIDTTIESLEEVIKVQGTTFGIPFDSGFMARNIQFRKIGPKWVISLDTERVTASNRERFVRFQNRDRKVNRIKDLRKLSDTDEWKYPDFRYAEKLQKDTNWWDTFAKLFAKELASRLGGRLL
jgi:hypothetical protein